MRRAETGSGYCRRHGDAIFGAMLGAIVYEKAVDEEVHVEAEKWPRREDKDNAEPPRPDRSKRRR